MTATASASVFVTVGTTKFDELIAECSKITIHKALYALGFRKLIIQFGRGLEPKIPETSPLAVERYRFKSTLEPDIKNCKLMISHAGAGSIIEGLQAKKHLLVVVNENLMENHQWEIAIALESDQYLETTVPSSLLTTLKTLDLVKKRKIYPAINKDLFESFVDSEMGFR